MNSYIRRSIRRMFLSKYGTQLELSDKVLDNKWHWYPQDSMLLEALNDTQRDANEKKETRKPHWAKALKIENERLKSALDYLTLQMRITVQSRFDKYSNCGDGLEAMAYRKCAAEVGLRLDNATQVAREITEGSTGWDSKTSQFV